jgi:hypothetical protein
MPCNGKRDQSVCEGDSGHPRLGERALTAYQAWWRLFGKSDEPMPTRIDLIYTHEHDHGREHDGHSLYNAGSPYPLVPFHTHPSNNNHPHAHTISFA